MCIALLLLACSTLFAQVQYDLLLKGGHVIDPKNNINAVRDVAIKDKKIAAVEANIAPDKAKKVVDVKGLYVTPGLIDIHVHVFAGGMGREYASGALSVFPDGHTFRSGVTTVVDAGTSGYRNFEEFKARTIDRAKTRVLAFLNIVGHGMGGGNDVEQNTQDMDPKPAAAMAKKYPQVIVGFKSAHYQGPEWISVDGALNAGKETNLPVMVDFGTFRPERPHEDLITKRLRPGDMYTHTFLASVPMLDENNKVRPYLFEGRKRGVFFDVGHGGGSFIWRWAVPAMQQGFLPDSISTDLHVNSMNAGMKDQLNVMSKFLNMGMSLQDAILRSTWNPAKQIKRQELGHLTVGAGADVAVLSLQKGSFGFVDVLGAKLSGNQKLVGELTVRDGMVVWDLNGLTRTEWNKLDKRYTSQADPVWDGTLGGGGGGGRRGKKKQ